MHPEAAASLGFGNWTSVDEATQNGALTAFYSGLWAEYLTARACGYREAC